MYTLLRAPTTDISDDMLTLLTVEYLRHMPRKHLDNLWLKAEEIVGVIDVNTLREKFLSDKDRATLLKFLECEHVVVTIE